MERLVVYLAVITTAASSAASEPNIPALSCVPAAGLCGCSVVVAGASCPYGGAHFFHELVDGSPLQFSPGKGLITATSTQAELIRTSTFSPGPGDSWVETYLYSGGNIEIRYSPAESTCSKPPHDEPCEYFDVRARVLIAGPQGTQSYSGVGTCGC